MKLIFKLFILVLLSLGHVLEAKGQNFLDRLYGGSGSGSSSTVETEAQSDAECPSCYERLYQNNHTDLREISRQVLPSSSDDESESLGIEGRSYTQDSWSDIPTVANYSDSPQVQKLIKTAVQRKRIKPRYVRLKSKRVKVRGKLVRKKGVLVRAEGQCYSYVKQALLSAKMVNFRPPGQYARQGVRDLKDQGFINMLDYPQYRKRIDSPGSAPKGALLVYSKENGAGHIEIKMDHGTGGGYISEYWNESSILQDELSGMAARRYKLIGVMIKPVGDEN